MAVGIIAEYNPFHAGHAYQIAQVKKFSDEPIVAVMSGSFTQRGEPTILDKWTRARLAIFGGVDLVLELPFVNAVRSARDFARGGIRLLESLGVVNTLAFGAETDLSTIKRAAATFNETFFSNELHQLMSQGISYAAAVTKILANATTVDEKILRQPNTILAVEYLRALPEKISPLLIERRGSCFKSDGTIGALQCCDNSNVVAVTKCSPARFIAAHNDSTLHEEFSSALAIRSAVRQPSPPWQKISAQVPAETLTALRDEKLSGFVDEKFLFRPLVTKVLTSTAADLRKIFDMTEGVEFRLFNAASTAKNFSELVTLIVNRRFTASRVRRLLLYVLLDVTNELIAEVDGTTVARILAFNERGQRLLKKISAVSSTPIVTKLTKHLNRRDVTERTRTLAPLQKILLLDVLATNLRELLFEPPRQPNKDFTMPPAT